MRPLIDADILLYEIGFSSESYETVEENGAIRELKELVPRSWDFCEKLFDEKVKHICEEVGATEPPLLFLTNTGYINKQLNRKRKWQEESLIEFVPNFREQVAKTKEYKGGRKQQKPFHFKNLINHIIGNYPYFVDENGLEADDAMCIIQLKANNEGKPTIICSRDKDLRQCPGWHYSWECGKQTSVGPLLVDGLGYLKDKNEGKVSPTTLRPLPLKVFGVGNKFFYYQMLTGDSVDNIIGAMGRGPVFAYNLLKNVETERECYEATAAEYVKLYGDDWKDKWEEMVDLLWIVKELDEEGKVVRWQIPK